MMPEMPPRRALQAGPRFWYGSAKDNLDFPMKAASRKGFSRSPDTWSQPFAYGPTCDFKDLNAQLGHKC